VAGDPLLQAGFPPRGQPGLATTPMGLRFQGATNHKLLPDPAHGGHTETEARGNFIGAFALFIEVDDPFADGQRNRSQDPTLPDPSAL
jgi:hypothetical protein